MSPKFAQTVREDQANFGTLAVGSLDRLECEILAERGSLGELVTHGLDIGTFARQVVGDRLAQATIDNVMR